MNFKKHWLKMALLFAVTAVIGFALPTTIAYIVKQSNTVINLFDADYTPASEGGVDIQVKKIVTALGEETIPPEGFQFYLVNKADETENYTLTTDSLGQAGLSLFYGDADVGKEFIYSLSEINGDMEHVTYSDVVYTIRILPKVNEENKVYTEIYVNDLPVDSVAVQFENIYAPQPEPPDTGDRMPMIILSAMVLLSGCALIFLIHRRRTFN